MAIVRKPTFPVRNESAESAFNQQLANDYSQANPGKMYQPVSRNSKYRIMRDAETGEETVEPIIRLVVHEFSVGDVDEPDLYAAQELYRWQQSAAGAWVLSHALHPPTWHRHIDYQSFGYRFRITAEFAGADATWLSLSDMIPQG